MTWTLKSPGIYTAEYEGYILTKIEIARVLTGRIVCDGGPRHGLKETVPVYSYVAIKPGTAMQPVTRFSGNDFNKIMAQISATLQTTLF